METVKPKTKILFATSHLFPATIGGSGMDAFWLGKGLTHAGLQVETITTDWGIPDGVVPKNQWVETECGKVNYTTQIHDLLPIRMTREALRRINEVDLVQLNGLWHPSSPILARTALKNNKPVIWSVHGGLDEAAMSYSALRKRMVLAYIKRNLAQRVLFRSTCKRESDRIREVFGNQTRIVEIPIFLYFNDLVARTEQADPYFLFIGRVHPIKAIDRLIEALAISKKFAQSKARLVIAGNHENDYGNELAQLADRLGMQDRVEFAGHVEGDEKDQLIANAHWAFLPSMTENMGVVVLECMAQGTPYTTSKGTPWQNLAEENIGYWIDNTPESLAQNVDEILCLPKQQYADLRLRCIEFTHKNFGVNQRIDTWLECYSSVIG